MLACLLMFEISSQSDCTLLGVQWLLVNRRRMDDKQTQCRMLITEWDHICKKKKMNELINE